MNNVAPTLQIPLPREVIAGEVASFVGFFTDPSPVDTHTVDINWDDGWVISRETPSSDRLIDDSHRYSIRSDPKTFRVVVTVTDDDGGIAWGMYFIRVVPPDGPPPPPPRVTTTLGDLNGDGRINRRDLLIYRGAYGTKHGESSYLESADLNRDRSIDLMDLRILAIFYIEEG